MKSIFYLVVMAALSYLVLSQFVPLQDWASARLGIQDTDQVTTNTEIARRIASLEAQVKRLSVPSEQNLAKKKSATVGQLSNKQKLEQMPETNEENLLSNTTNETALIEPIEVKAAGDVSENTDSIEFEANARVSVENEQALRERAKERRRELAVLAERLELRAAGLVD